MGDFFSKIEDFLFDILGLVLPGLIFLSILILPTYLLNISAVPHRNLDSSYILSGLATLSGVLKIQWSTNTNATLAVVIILAYLAGHVVKVFSIIKYEFMRAIFDKFLNKAVIYSFERLKYRLYLLILDKWRINMYETKVYKYLKTLFKPVKDILTKIFTFESPNYFKDNDALRSNCINKINQKFRTKFPDEWYSLYKFSAIINAQESLKSLAGNFLAKYNLYRSLAFIFIFTAIYFNYFFNAASEFIPDELSKVIPVILITSVLLWFTFHHKYKRYWTLSGNESLLFLYYFLNKK